MYNLIKRMVSQMVKENGMVMMTEKEHETLNNKIDRLENEKE